MAASTFEPPWVRTIDLAQEWRHIRAWWRQPQRLRRLLAAYRNLLAAAPASIAYAFTLFVTWWTLRGTSDAFDRRLILSASTNLRNLQRDPIQVLVASAFWTEGGFPWSAILVLLTFMALAERWLGSLRWILVVACGHICATLLVAVGIAHKVDRHLIPLRVTVAADVGPSYGISAMLAVLAFRLRGPARWIWAAGLLLFYGTALWQDRTFTDYGHFFALLIGFLIGGSAVVVSRRVLPLLRRSAPDRIDGGPRPGIGNGLAPLEEPDGRLDEPRDDRPEHRHH